MTLSTSRQQFLACEPNGTQDIQYQRKGGIFISSCICISLIICAIIVAVIVGVIVHFITYFKLSQKSVEFWDETEPFRQTGAPSPNLRLPTTIVPSFYRLKLNTSLENLSFNGNVYITLRASSRTKEIILHAKNLSISNSARLTEQIYEKEALHPKVKREVSSNNSTSTENVQTTTLAISNVNDTLVNDTALSNVTEPTVTTNEVKSDVTTSPSVTEAINVSETTSTQTTVSFTPPLNAQVTHSRVRDIRILSITQGTGDRLVLLLQTAIQANVDYVLELSFAGNITDSMTGFYRSSYINEQGEERKVGVTQFEPTSARSAFPCFDEPAFKAKFEISIAHPKNISALSNMKVSAQEPIPEQPNYQWTHFERSVSMSTYLVAYVLCDFKYLETSYLSKDNITKSIRIWARPQLIDNAQYALNITPKLISYYEDVFGLPYVLDKLDLIAIPEFSSGAMENWGLITFRETTLLYDEKQSVPRDKQSVAVDIAHELAHQWFGNLVTMRWWTDLWLNEGFATYIEYVGVDHISPSWRMLESFSRDKMDLLRTDALKNTSPVSLSVMDSAEISQKFDEISYTKGANLIRMLNHTISEELFRKAILVYLTDWKYSNAEENDLWTAMSTVMQAEPSLRDLSVVQFMNTWTRQPGYPVVKVNRNYDTGDIELEQRLFTSAKNPYQNMVDQLWHIPISYTMMNVPVEQWSTKPKTWLRGRFKVEHTNLTKDQALYVNVGAIGYYRVNYDQHNWQLLRTALKSGLVKSSLTKAQLIDDAFNLAKVSQLDYSYALGLTTCVIDGEDSKIVWDLLLNNMAFLKYNLRETPGYIYFQDYMQVILKKQLQKLNYGLEKPTDDNQAFLIENLVMWECHVESPRCLDWVKSQFDSWASQSDLTQNPIPSYLRSLVYNIALRHGGRREFDFLWRAFNNATDPATKSVLANSLASTRDESLLALLLERSLTSMPKQYAVAAWSVEAPSGTRVAQRFLVEKFSRVRRRFADIDAFSLPAVVSGAFGFITTQDDLDKLKSFALKHKEELMPMSQTLQKLVDTATLRIEWVKNHAAGINKWFENYVNGNLMNNVTLTTPSSAQPTTLNVTTPVVTDLPTVATEIISNATETISNATETISNATETISNATETTSNSTSP